MKVGARWAAAVAAEVAEPPEASRCRGFFGSTARSSSASGGVNVFQVRPVFVLANRRSERASNPYTESQDGGQTWKAVANGLAGHLAWPTPGRAYLADLNGAFFTASTAGGPWREHGELGGPAAALLAVDERTLFAALHDDTIVRSGDGGATWKVRATP